MHRPIMIFIVILSLSFSHIALCDSNENQYGSTNQVCTWFRLGGGGDSERSALEAGILQLRGMHLITLSGVYSEIAPPNATEAFATPLKSDWCIGLLYGRFYRMKYVLFSASAGVGITGGQRDTNSRTFGPILALPGELMITLTPAKWFGLSLQGYGYLNKEENLGLIMVSLNFGRLR